MIAKKDEQFHLGDYLAYVFYPPLYIAGPIMTYNSFRAQQASSKDEQRIPWTSIFTYAVRWMGCFLLLDIILSVFHVCAIKERRLFTEFTPIQTFALAYFLLTSIWLKLLVIWRFFRGMAIVDGMVPPENMLRCMTNNYSFLGFWRQWHHSFNLWVTR